MSYVAYALVVDNESKMEDNIVSQTYDVAEGAGSRLVRSIESLIEDNGATGDVEVATSECMVVSEDYDYLVPFEGGTITLSEFEDNIVNEYGKCNCPSCGRNLEDEGVRAEGHAVVQYDVEVDRDGAGRVRLSSPDDVMDVEEIEYTCGYCGHDVSDIVDVEEV